MIQVYKKLISYAPEKSYLLIFTVILSIASALLQILAYHNLYGLLYETVAQENFTEGWNYALKITAFLIAGAIAYFFSLLSSHFFAFRLETNLRKHGIDGLLNASFSFFDKNSSGKVRKIIDDNAAQTHTAVAHLIPDNTGAMIMPILIIILGFVLDIKIGAALTAFTILSIILLFFMMGEKDFMKIYQESLEKLSAETVEYIRGMQVVKIFGIDVRSFKALNNAIKSYGKYALNYSLSCRIPYVLFQCLFFSVSAIIIPIVIYFQVDMIDPSKVVLHLIMLFFLSGLIFTYMMRIMYVSMYVFMASDAVSKLEDIYDEMKKDSLSFGSETKFDNYDIEFENVTFCYKDDPVIENLSFTLEEGKSYALVGSSGSGKSTIAKLISGFYKIQSGSIKIGSKDLTTYDEKAIISNISFVFQNPKLFKASIYDNIAVANKNASSSQVKQAMDLAGCTEIASKFPDKENTIIGSKGVYLSGGEKQRIAIARAILKDAKIVIFDEASAAIDPDNEHELQRAFSHLMKDKTVIMIAHRLTSIKNVDEILVIDHGKIIERGSDQELMSKDTKYKKLQALYSQANSWMVMPTEGKVG